MGRRFGGVIVCTALCAAITAAPADATFRGGNGKIAHVYDGGGNLEIYTVNPDGTGRTNITNNPAQDQWPRWSPDGTKILFMRGPLDSSDTWLMEPDGSNQTQLTTHPGYDSLPDWSPDGTKIVFSSDRDGDGSNELWTMDSDGSNETLLTTGASPSWSPDGSQLVFQRYLPGPPFTYDVYRINANGSGLTPLTPEPEHTNNPVPLWSPDGTTIAFQDWPPRTSGGYDIWTMNPDGSGKDFIYIHALNLALRSWEPAGQRLLLTPLTTMNADGTNVRRLWQNHQFPDSSDPYYRYVSEIWSPDARYAGGSRQICYDSNIPCQASHVYVLDVEADTLVDISEGSSPDWQPIPITGYPRPLATEPLKATMAVAYEPCTSPNRTHGPPLENPSCAPPVKSSSQLTVGTFDANGRSPNATANVILIQVVGNPNTPADEADIGLHAEATDVRLASDLSDYSGSLEARMTLRITDKDNTPNPGGPGAATVKDIPYSFPVACAVTPATDIGSSCGVDTTADSLVPGTVKEKRRTVWALGQVALRDGAGNAFMRQGLFVP